MKMLNALFFPGTRIRPETAAHLLGLLDTVTCYQITGDETQESDFSDRVVGYVPVPLGGDKERFVGMMKDLEANQADYYGGLLSMISAASRYDRDESSVWNLIARLHRGDESEAREERLKDKLWRARLVLNLAEILDEEMADVGSGLSEVEKKEQKLFAALHGDLAEVEEGEGLKDTPVPVQSQDQINYEVLMAAWGTLHVLDEDAYGMLVSDRESCTDLLFDVWAGKADAEPIKLCEVSLPFAGDIKDVAGFAEAREDLRNAISGVATGGGKPGELKKAGARYQQTIEDKGVAAGASLALYLLSGYPIKEAFAAISGVRPVVTRDSCLVGIINSG